MQEGSRFKEQEGNGMIYLDGVYLSIGTISC